MSGVKVTVEIEEETPENVADVLVLIAKQIEGGFKSGFDRRVGERGGRYRYVYDVEEVR